MNNFAYFAPETVEEAVRLLADHNGRAKPLAGGTDLLVFMRDRKVTPEALVDLRRVMGLQGIEEKPDGSVRIGALTPMRDIELSPLIGERYPSLVTAVREVGGIQIRNLATLGGNACNASPAADTPAALMTLDAAVRLQGPAGARELPLREFFLGPGQTVLQPAELLTDFLLPPAPLHSGGSAVKLGGRRAMDIAFVGAAAWVVLGEGSVVEDARVALWAVAPTIRRVPEAEEALRGRRLDDGLLEEVAGAAEAASQPITDHRASAEYRRLMTAVLARRVVKQAVGQAQLANGRPV